MGVVQWLLPQEILVVEAGCHNYRHHHPCVFLCLFLCLCGSLDPGLCPYLYHDLCRGLYPGPCHGLSHDHGLCHVHDLCVFKAKGYIG